MKAIIYEDNDDWFYDIQCDDGALVDHGGAYDSFGDAAAKAEIALTSDTKPYLIGQVHDLLSSISSVAMNEPIEKAQHLMEKAQRLMKRIMEM